MPTTPPPPPPAPSPTTAPPSASPSPAPAASSSQPAGSPTPISFLKSRTARNISLIWRYRSVGLLGAGVVYGLVQWRQAKVAQRKADYVAPETVLYWKIYDGGIVEAKSTGSFVNSLVSGSLGTGGGDPSEPAHVMSLFDVIRALKTIEKDPRIVGLIADFSSTSLPSVPSAPLGLAQLEEIQDALISLRKAKQETMGDKWRSVAWSDSFASQGQYLFATMFGEVYTQPSGSVPLVGFGSTTPFYGRLLKFLGVHIQAEARTKYKSFVQPYIDEQFTPDQQENRQQLLSSLNDNLVGYIARHRFTHEASESAVARVKDLSQIGPFSAKEAVKVGLLDGTMYRQELLDSMFPRDAEGESIRGMKGFYHYSTVLEKASRALKEGVVDIGIVYLTGTIGAGGEFGTAAVIRGLREAAKDPDIDAIVLRVDSGGGGVVDSDSIWAAVQELRKEKTVVASFGNAAASGGYLVSTHADAILASPSTITGSFVLPPPLFQPPGTDLPQTHSIGVAALRPTILQTFFDRLYITFDSLYTGSRALDPTHTLSPSELKRYADSVDECYADFKRSVCEGRSIDSDAIEELAGGKVYSGLQAWELTKGEGEDVRAVSGLSEDVVLQIGNDVEVEVVKISEDQETSPYAITEPTEAEKHVPGVWPAPATKLGRGLVDAIGGTFEAAVVAWGLSVRTSIHPSFVTDKITDLIELFVSGGVPQIKREIQNQSATNPALVDSAPHSLFPYGKAALNVTEDGEVLSMEGTLRLKRFPVAKPFWKRYQDTLKLGQSSDVPSVSEALKIAAASWFINLAASVVSQELSALGLGMNDARGGLGLGTTQRKNWIRAEWAGFNLR